MQNVVHSETFLNARIDLVYLQSASAYIGVINSRPLKNSHGLIIESSKDSLIKLIRDMLIKGMR